MAAPTGRPAKLPPGPAALWDWMQSKGLNQRESARLLQMNFVSLNQILMARRRPGLAVALRLFQHTGIKPGIWLRTKVRESQTQSRAVSS